MTMRQKTAAAKAAIPSPGQLAKSQPAPLALVAQTPTEPQVPTQPPPEMLTMKDLQTALASALSTALSTVNDKLDKLEEKIEEQKKDFKAMIEAHNSEIREDIVEAIKGVWDYTVGVEGKLEGVEQQLEEKLEEIRSDLQDQNVLTQYHHMQMAVRIRGLREITKETQEDLRKTFVEALATFLGDTVENVAWQMERIFRMNSRIAAQRNLPRDIVIYFSTRKFRNWVLTKAYNKQLSVAGQEVQVLKEIPPKMLRARKDYAFLTDELKKREIQYRWEVPSGLSLFFQNNRYRLTSVAKAKDFFENILLSGKFASPRPKRAAPEKDMESSQLRDLQLTSTPDKDKELAVVQTVQNIDIFQPLVAERPKEQRYTREAIEIMDQREITEPIHSKQGALISLEAMGARPKRREEVVSALQKLSQKGHVK